MKKSLYWSLALIAMLFVAGLVTHKTLAQTEGENQTGETPIVENQNISDDQGDIVDSEEGDLEDVDGLDEQSSEEGEVEGASFAAFKKHGDDDDDDDNGHINICHILGNGGYNQISVSKSGNLNGHDNHGADIIPPFEKSGPDYPGKNWTTEGQAIWNNGCQPLPETGSITIVKVIADGSNQDSEFTFTPNWKENFSLGGGDSNVSSELEEGVYTIIETVPDGWNYPTVECTDQSAADDGEATINLDEGEDVTCTFTNSEEEVPPPTTTTIRAQKIICDEESDLPNWGAGNSDITSTTASDWLAEHNESGCYLADWDFEWSYRSVAGDPDDNTPGFLGGNWYPFANGEAIVDVANDGQLGIREVFDEDYIPFTGQNTNEDVSAEMYCGDDVLHYDNWEWINATAGQPIYCVAWNVPVEQEHACRVQVVSQTGDEGIGNGNAVAAWIHTSWTHALESVATWIWDSYEVVDASQTEAKTFTKDFYVDGPVNDAMLKLAADNRYWITINGNEVASNTGELNYGAVTGPIDVKVTGNIQSGWNTITMKVENIGLEGYEQRPHDNPAAGIYELIINAEEEELCKQPPVDTTSDVTICKYQNSVSEQNGLSDWTVWLDENDIIVSKDTIVVDDSHVYSGETSENGCVTFKDVEFGDYTIGEDMPEGWQNVVDADSAVAAGSVVDVNDTTETFNLVNTLSCNPKVNLIKNGGFEAPVLADNSWSIFTSPTMLLEWLTGDEGIEIQNSAAGSPFAGEQLAELDPNHPTTIWQDIPTIPGATYRLETQYSPRPGRDAEDNRFEFRVDGSTVGASIARDGSANGDTVWTLESRTFVAASTTSSVGFAEAGTDTSYGAYLDEVGLYCIPEVVEDPELTLDKSGVYDEETGTITFTLDWSVTGDGTIYDVTITDPVPAGTSFVSANNSGYLSGSDVIWNLGDVSAVASGSVSFTVALDEVAAIGFYADNYDDNFQGTRKDGSGILVDRTDANAALGAPQSAGLSNDAPVVAGSFFALGFSEAPAVGGSIVLTFSTPVMNGVGNDLKVFEVTGGSYPDETVQVEAWDIGTASWVNLGNVTRDGEVDLGSVLTTNQIRLTDVSTKALFPNDGDAYDVDALQAYYTAGSVCSIDNIATITGSEGKIIVERVVEVYDQEEYDFSTSASTTVVVNEKDCEPQGDDDDDDDDDDDASVDGYKWNDINNDADDEEGGEPRLPNWPIELYGTNDGWYLLATTTTDGYGYYSFDNLNGGTYAICEGDVSGWTQTYPIGEFYPDNCHLVTLDDGEDDGWFAFGNHQNPEVTGDDDDDDNNGRPGSNRNSFRGRGEVLGATTETNFCPFLRDYQHINMENDPSEVNKAKAFFNSYLGLSLPLDGTFDQSMFGAVVQFQNMFKPDVLDTWTEEFPGVLDDNATGYLYQTTKWKINSIICPGYETFPDQLIMAPGTTI